MQKIISLFQRNYDGDRQVRDEIVPGAEWVIQGLGVATRKWDGTCCFFDKYRQLYKRYDAKNGKQPPEGFLPAQDPDPITGHWPGWIKISDTANEDQWFREGLANTKINLGIEGTFELVGPKINGNPEKLRKHILILHGTHIIDKVPRTFNELKAWFVDKDIEGIVWHNDTDGKMVKIKKRDFGMKREVLTTA